MQYKLVCFDLDGTIVDETIFIWQTIHDFLETDSNQREQAKTAFEKGNITYAEWAGNDIRMWKEKGAKKEDILDAIRPLKLMKNAESTLTQLKEKGIKLALISGSMDIVLDHLLPEYDHIFDYIFINRIVFKGEEIEKIITTPYDFHHKAKALRLISEQENIHLDECVFVGDHHNDVGVAKIAGLSISFNSKSKELDSISDVIIKEKNLNKVLKFILS